VPTPAGVAALHQSRFVAGAADLGEQILLPIDAAAERRTRGRAQRVTVARGLCEDAEPIAQLTTHDLRVFEAPVVVADEPPFTVMSPILPLQRIRVTSVGNYTAHYGIES